MLMWLWENVLVKHYPQITGYVLIAFLAGWIVWKFRSVVSPLDNLSAKLDGLATKEGLGGIKETVDKMEPDLRDIRERFARVEDRVEVLWKDKYAPAGSPRRLNERGNAILTESGMDSIISARRDELLAKVREFEPKTAYDAEEIILETVAVSLKEDPATMVKIKDGAFRTGSDIDTVLFVGGMHLRDLIFGDLGFKLDDIDNDQKN